jgi:hypothetical protein
VLGCRGHTYAEMGWPGVTGVVCWDTGAAAAIVDRGFWLSHPELFEQIGVPVGTDDIGEHAGTPLLLMAGPVIGQRPFSKHKAVAVDLSGANATLDCPMDLIRGWPTLRKAYQQTTQLPGQRLKN